MGARENKRRAERLHHAIPVAYKSVGSFLSDWATNISRGGIFINTRKPLPVGTPVKILIQLPGAAFPCELAGRVTRVAESDDHASTVPGMAIEFTEVEDSRRREIDAFVEKLRAKLE